MFRERVVSVINLVLACWERELGRPGLDLAEETRIWPVHIGKSNPMTRTLDKYLNLDIGPDKPTQQARGRFRSIRVAKFGDNSNRGGEQLQTEPDSIRKRESGVKTLVAKPGWQPARCISLTICIFSINN